MPRRVDGLELDVADHECVAILEQAVVVLADGLEREDLGIDLGLEIEDQTHDVRPVLAHPHLLDIRVVGLDLGDQLFQGGVELDTLDIDHQPLGVFDDEVACLEFAVVLQRDAGIFLCRPDAHC